MRLTRTFRISGLSVLAGIILTAVPHVPTGLKVLGILALSFAGPVFAVSAVRHALRGLLWRVGSRLLVSYLIVGLVPIPLMLGLVFAGVCIVAGQLASRRAEAALKNREASLQQLALEVLPAIQGAGTPAGRREAIARASARRPDLPGLSYRWEPKGGAPESNGVLATPGASLPVGPDVPVPLVGRLEKSLHLLARSQSDRGALVLSIPFGAALKRRLKEETGVEVDTPSLSPRTAASRKPRKGGVTISAEKETLEVKPPPAEDPDLSAAVEEVADSTAREKIASGLGILTSPWVRWILAVSHPVANLAAGTVDREGRVVLSVRTSIAGEAGALFGHERIGSTRSSETGRLVLQILTGLAFFTALVYAVAALIAGVLVLRIARATRRLSGGFAEIENGNFAHRVSLKGEDQLGALVRSFNAMAAHLSASVSVRAEREAIERELALARTIQRQLLPPSDLEVEGVDIAVDFRPAAAIGGDFYDFVPDPPRSLTVVVGDVAGHGLPTGIVMASARASLSAFAKSGVTGARLLTLLDEEIRRTTGGRTFVTLAHLVLRFDEKRIDFTNAGHLYPYRVTPEGIVSALANPARPLGVALPAGFQTVSTSLEAGDIWVVLSDGIIEARSADGSAEFGFERLERILSSCGGADPITVRDRVLEEWRTLTGSDDPADDRTLVVLRVKPSNVSD